MADGDYTCYEQPLNERTRTFLRLEHLFAQLRHHERDESEWGRRAAMATLLDLLTIFARHDLRTECAKELSEQQAKLSRLRNHPDIDAERLDRLLHQLEALEGEMHRISPQFASYLMRDNELLSGISNRSAIPGGTCGFDLPGYRYWLNLPAEVQAEDLTQWRRHLAPFRATVELILALFRESAEAEDYVAEGGVLVHNTEPETQLLRVLVRRTDQVYPEISAGRHRSTIRFMVQDGESLRARQADRDISFKMACCRL